MCPALCSSFYYIREHFRTPHCGGCSAPFFQGERGHPSSLALKGDNSAQGRGVHRTADKLSRKEQFFTCGSVSAQKHGVYFECEQPFVWPGFHRPLVRDYLTSHAGTAAAAEELKRINRPLDHLRRKFHQNPDLRTPPQELLHAVKNQWLAALGIDFHYVNWVGDEFIQRNGR